MMHSFGDDQLEEDLKRALRRKQPPPDFASRVVARSRPRFSRWLTAAAAALAIVSGGLAYRQHEGEVAKEQVMLAVKIAAGKVNRIQTQVREATR